MNQTEQSLARIFAICDQVAESGKPLLSEDQGREAAKNWLGKISIKSGSKTPE